MSFSFRPAVREQLPEIYGIAGPSKSGKTFSALRMATGLANGGKIAMINTEGRRGHRYADNFTYDALDLTEPFTMKKYKEAIDAARAINPAVLIIDSVSHSHEGIGGMLDHHEAILDRIAGQDYQKRHKMTFTAWAEPKQDEAKMVNAMLQMDCFIILCFRAKEKLKIEKGKDPVSIGWQPISSDRLPYETAFTLILPPGSKGVPDMSAQASELRDPYDKIVTEKQIDEELGRKLAEWAKGTTTDLDPELSAEIMNEYLGKVAGCQTSEELKGLKEIYTADSSKDKMTKADRDKLLHLWGERSKELKKAA